MRVLLAAATAAVLAAVMFTPATPASALAPGSSGFVTIYPERLVEQARIGPRGTTTIWLANLPEEATAVTLNLTVAGATERTYLSLCRSEVDCTDTSVINAEPGRDIANLTVPALGASRELTLYNNAGSVLVSADLIGYFREGAGRGFTPSGPTRHPETLDMVSASTKDVPLTLGPRFGANAAVMIRVTASGVEENTYLTACSYQWPLSECMRWSTLNANRRDSSNISIVPIDANNRVRIFNNRGNARVNIDVLGVFTDDGQYGYIPMDPVRVMNRQVVTEQSSYITSHDEVPGSTAAAIFTNLTSAAFSEVSYISMCQSARETGLCATTSSLNPYPGSDIAGLGLTPYASYPGAGVKYFNNRGTGLLFSDIQGYFTQ